MMQVLVTSLPQKPSGLYYLVSVRNKIKIIGFCVFVHVYVCTVYDA